MTRMRYGKHTCPIADQGSSICQFLDKGLIYEGATSLDYLYCPSVRGGASWIARGA
ncbi:hypothetical protein GIB67_002220 [Kingdonia uniflora]|uniref:Uncharacterized protein n=1 Tax=Kingdonia uniflora TaxID=39325 RepID=A0A7J7KWR6_9MAGN|nr:hypothetical protein GIB67_002220 [Kingdonia uniflora]